MSTGIRVADVRGRKLGQGGSRGGKFIQSKRDDRDSPPALSNLRDMMIISARALSFSLSSRCAIPIDESHLH
jgi:hypothetical protein